LIFNLFLLLLACEVVAAPAVLVAASKIDIFGGGGAGRRGVFWLRGARGRLSGDIAVRSTSRSKLSGRTGTFSILSNCIKGACLFLLKVGGASFSWSCAEGRSGLGAGTLKIGCSCFDPDREFESAVADLCELERVGGGGDLDRRIELRISWEPLGLPEAKSLYVVEYKDARFASGSWLEPGRSV
jgi:hypothetical protein